MLYYVVFCIQDRALTKVVSNNEEIFVFYTLSIPGASKDEEINKANTKTLMAMSKFPTFTGQLKNCVFNFY